MAHEALKERQSVMWGNGPYDEVADTLADVHAAVIEALRPEPGQHWLDLACGTGRLSELAASGGATVVGIDLAPALIETAKERAASAGLAIDYRAGDCENLEGVADATFDVVSSTVGIMFAPDHEATARELARVVKPGGRIGLANWTAEGGVGGMFRLMAPFQAAPPPSSPFDWGNESRVRELLGDAFELQFSRAVSVSPWESSEAYWVAMAANYGPTKTLYESLGERGEELHRAWVEYFDANHAHEGGIAHDREYLLVIGTRR
jgi:SAM-dependent methyltransferase